MTDTILPTPDQIVGPAIEKLVSLRPAALQHINFRTGVYSWVIEGWKAQAKLELARIAQLVKTNRIPLCQGKDLVALISSEFQEEVDITPTTAVGGRILQREVTEDSPAGTIYKGTRFTRAPSDVPTQVVKGATFITTEDVKVAATDSTISVKMVASAPGSSYSKQSSSTTAYPLVANTVLFDQSLLAKDHFVGGGNDGYDDIALRNLARAAALGKFGPNEAAAMLGALRANGIRRVAVKDDYDNAALQLYVADSSWGSSELLCEKVKKSLRDQKLIGFGCKIEVLPVYSTNIDITATVTLRDKIYLNDTQDIQEKISESLRSYFDDRDDWYIWKTSGIKSAIINADTRILNVTSFDTSIDEPTVSDSSLFHYNYPKNSAIIEFTSAI